MGIFNISMALTQGLMNHPKVKELHIIGNNECHAIFNNCPPHVHLHLLDQAVPRRFGRIWWDQFGMNKIVRQINPDWLLLPKGYRSFFPLGSKTKIACYIHDVMWEHYEQRGIGDRGKAFPLHEFIYFKHLSLYSMRHADLVLTHSLFNKGRILHYAPHANIVRIGVGFNQAPLTNTSRKLKKAVLTYASDYPHKRWDLVIKRLSVWLAQREDADDIRILVAGSLPEHCQLPSKHWQHVGRIPFSELQTIMREQCRMAAYFSDYESYGMPPVECILNGVPCVASDIPPIRENIPAEYLFHNDNENDFIRVANTTFDAQQSITCKAFPTNEEMCNSCAQALADFL